MERCGKSRLGGGKNYLAIASGEVGQGLKAAAALAHALDPPHEPHDGHDCEARLRGARDCVNENEGANTTHKTPATKLLKCVRICLAVLSFALLALEAQHNKKARKMRAEKNNEKEGLVDPKAAAE